MTDLATRSTSGLLEDLARLCRYRKDLIRQKGREPFLEREETLVAELKRRKVAIPDFAPLPPYVPCRLRPLSDHVVVSPEEPAAITAGGLVVPETAKEKPMQGTVLAVGPGRTEPGVGTIVPAVVVGDMILFGRYAGTEVTLDGERVLILREEDVLGVLATPATP